MQRRNGGSGMWVGEGSVRAMWPMERDGLTKWKISPGGWRTEWRGRWGEAKFISGMHSKEVRLHDALLDHTFCVAQLGSFLEWRILMARTNKEMQITFIVFLFLQIKCVWIVCVCVYICIYICMCAVYVF